MTRPFKGTVNLDVRDSKPDWPAFLADKAPKDAPNVLVVLFDDTGVAAWSPSGVALICRRSRGSPTTG